MSDIEKIASILDGSNKDFTEPVSRFDGEVMTISVFLKLVETGILTDYDGFGLPVRDSKSAEGVRYMIYSSDLKNIPAGTTHILWFNR